MLHNLYSSYITASERGAVVLMSRLHENRVKCTYVFAFHELFALSENLNYL